MTHGKIADLIVAPQSRFYHGNFGRIFPDLPAWSPKDPMGNDLGDKALEKLFLDFANKEMVEIEGKKSGEIAGKEDQNPALDSKIPAGYTYFGQFIDHDITLDSTPLGSSEVDPNRLHNFRTPRLDLDCVYGGGPSQSPYLFKHVGGAMTGELLIGKIPGTKFDDLQRNGEGRAIIGDMRNDENAIVAQIQLAFIKAHNELVRRIKKQRPKTKGGEAFQEARRILQWLYQWIVWNDFMRRITNENTRECALEKKTKCGDRAVWELGLKDVYFWKKQPFMPVEFSVAAYRFGHSMARNSYRTNIGKNLAGLKDFIPLFDVTRKREKDLSGFNILTKKRVVQWDWFLDMKSSIGPDFPQMARKIDTNLSNALVFLREDEGPKKETILENKLPARNLVRSVRMNLPSGLDVAKKLGVKPIKLKKNEPEALWFYILKEASLLPGAHAGNMLGQVGSVIICATFAGLLKGDGNSWINRDPNWTPDDEPLLDACDKRDEDSWTLASIIRMAKLPIKGSHIEAGLSA